MVLSVQTFAQQISPSGEQILFDITPINENLANYVPTHGGIAVINPGIYVCTFTVNSNLQGIAAECGNIIAQVTITDGGGSETIVRKSICYGRAEMSALNPSPNTTNNNQFQMELLGGELIKVYASYDGTGTLSTIPKGSILTLFKI